MADDSDLRVIRVSGTSLWSHKCERLYLAINALGE